MNITSLAEGRLPETFGGWSKGRSLRAGLVSLPRGGLGAPPGRHYDRSARSFAGLGTGAKCLVPGSVARGAKNAAVERREASVLRHWARNASLGVPGAPRHGAPRVPRKDPAPPGAPLPSMGSTNGRPASPAPEFNNG